VGNIVMAGLHRQKMIRGILVNWQLYLFVLPVVVYLIIFRYVPMYGIQIAFKNYRATRGIWGSQWIGLDNFIRFFNSYYFITVMKNTFTITLMSLVLGFPAPILLALSINEITRSSFKKTVQTVTFAPHFISTVVICGMLLIFLNPTSGIANHLLAAVSGKRINFMQESNLFKWIYVLSGIWQEAGWGAIIYFAALSGVSPELHESARIDGANKFQRIVHINIPVLLPTIIILLILRCGSLLSVGYEKVFLLQNDLNISASEVISTYVYKSGLIKADFSFSTAVDLFNSVVNATLLLLVNFLSKKVGETSLL
jgi:putative aldouronate transport system permease protein